MTGWRTPTVRITGATSPSCTTSASGSTPTSARARDRRIPSPIRERDGLVVELGCGSGLLTRYLVGAGHRVIATDASPAMLDLARGYAVGAQEIRALVLPDEPIPEADAVISVGHVLSYLPDAGAIDRALVAIADALRPGGILAIDLCELTYAESAAALPVAGRVEEGWAILTERSSPAPDR